MIEAPSTGWYQGLSIRYGICTLSHIHNGDAIWTRHSAFPIETLPGKDFSFIQPYIGSNLDRKRKVKRAAKKRAKLRKKLAMHSLKKKQIKRSNIQLKELIKLLEAGKYDTSPTELKQGSEHLYKLMPDGNYEPFSESDV